MSGKETVELKEKIIKQLEKMAFYDAWECFDLSDEGCPVLKKGNGQILEGFEITKTGLKARLPDRMKALEQLQKFVDYGQEHIELTFSDDALISD